MSARYYIVTAILVVGLTLAISWWKEKRSTREILVVFCQVAGGLALIFLGVAGLAKLLAVLGVAESGFFL